MSGPPRGDIDLTPKQAWQPFTPRGVAAFAQASVTRLVLVQLAVAILLAAATVWFLRSQWFPVIEHAIERLPTNGVIRHGTMTTSIPAPARLAENRSLAVAVDVEGTGRLGRVADLEVTLQARALDFCGMLGCSSLTYPRGYIISFNRVELEPWWGAWRTPLAALAGFLVITKLLVSWWMLALILWPVVKLIAFYCDRHVTLGGSIRLAAAALLPGAFLVTGGIVLYGLGAIDVVRLALVYLLHLGCGAIFVATAPLFLPRLRGRRKNPFVPPGGDDGSRDAGRKSPFAARNPK